MGCAHEILSPGTITDWFSCDCFTSQCQNSYLSTIFKGGRSRPRKLSSSVFAESNRTAIFNNEPIKALGIF
jgi:hypothetical protein